MPYSYKMKEVDMHESSSCFQCLMCSGTVRHLAKPGRFLAYRAIILELPADIKILTCDRCGSRYGDKAASVALEDIYHRDLERIAMTKEKRWPEKYPHLCPDWDLDVSVSGYYCCRVCKELPTGKW